MARAKNGFFGDVIHAASGTRMSFSGSSFSYAPSRYFGDKLAVRFFLEERSREILEDDARRLWPRLARAGTKQLRVLQRPQVSELGTSEQPVDQLPPLVRVARLQKLFGLLGRGKHADG